MDEVWNKFVPEDDAPIVAIARVVRQQFLNSTLVREGVCPNGKEVFLVEDDAGRVRMLNWECTYDGWVIGGRIRETAAYEIIQTFPGYHF